MRPVVPVATVPSQCIGKMRASVPLHLFSDQSSRTPASAASNVTRCSAVAFNDPSVRGVGFPTCNMFAELVRRSGKMGGAHCVAHASDACLLPAARRFVGWDDHRSVHGRCQVAAITGSFLEQSFCLGRIHS